MTNDELKQLSKNFNVCGSLQGVELAWLIAKNNKTIMKKASELNKRIADLQEEHAEKDATTGKPVIVEGNYKMVDLEAFNKVYMELMDQEVDIEFHKIKYEMLPTNINATQMSALLEMMEPKDKFKIVK